MLLADAHPGDCPAGMRYSAADEDRDTLRESSKFVLKA
jgi:hypothetical protein